MKVVKFPHPALLTPCKAVTVFGPALAILLEGMYDTMLQERGLGLSANQVDLSFRMFTMAGPKEEKLYIVNPEIIKKSIAPANLREGCLSAPGEFLVVPERSSWVELKYQDETGKSHNRVFQGIHAVCVQHEVDHLDGKSHLQAKSLSKKVRQDVARRWGLK